MYTLQLTVDTGFQYLEAHTIKQVRGRVLCCLIQKSSVSFMDLIN